MMVRWMTAMIACCAVVFSIPVVSRAGRMQVFVSILPQKYFVEKIGGDSVDVSVMVPPGASPAAYEPRPGQMAKLSEAAVYFSVGVPFEKAWLQRFASAAPRMRIVHTDVNVPKVPMATHIHGEKSGDHGDGHGDHSGGNLDPHIWMSPPLVGIQARTICDALAEIDPAHAADYRSRHASFEKEINALDHELREILSGDKGSAFMVFHPAYGYFARAYGLEQIPVEVEGKSPSPRELAAFITLAEHKGVGVIFVQPQFSMKSARTIARAVGAEVEAIDPLSSDWKNNLVKAARAVHEAVR